MEALDQITENGVGAWLGHWGLFALFVCFECLPVVVKILMSSGKPTPYEMAVGVDERARSAVFDKETASQEQRATEQVDNDQLAWQGVAMEAARAKAEAELRVYLADLARWEAGATGLAAGPARSRPGRALPGFGNPRASRFPGQGDGWRTSGSRRRGRGRPKTGGYAPPGPGPVLPGTYAGDPGGPLPFLREPPPTGTPPTGTPPPGTADANGSGTYPGSGPGSSRPGTAGA